jgi:pimeloyl-ACP methyl ester carboxylesterase
MVTKPRVLIAIALFAACGLGGCSPLSAAAAGGLLHPVRRHVTVAAPQGCIESRIQSEGLALAGWRCGAVGNRRGTVVYLHGIADNRASARGIIQRYRARGLDVLAYDSRGHGDSGGETCTYGFFEKQDLRRIIDSITSGPVILLGTSLGAAVAIQEAADDPRVSAIVAAEVFSVLRTVARERAPFFLTDGTIKKAFSLAERDGTSTLTP